VGLLRFQSLSTFRRSLFLLIVAALAHAATDPLRGRFTIYRDDYGVPHIVGDTEEATFFGYGYAQAEDHLERMMLEFRDAQGRRSEVEGDSAVGGEYLQFIQRDYRWGGDYLQRLLRTKKAVVEDHGKIEIYGILDAFARGINAYIQEHRTGIPRWVEPVTAEDIEALERSYYTRFYSIHEALAKLFGYDYPIPHLGSNQWAISRERSANGRIIHVEHLHMPWANRFQNYEAHLITPGKLNVGGVSWFGSPFFLAGFNDHITWSVTWNSPNISDVYEEKINPANHLQYLYEGTWRPIRVERETINVKGPKGPESRTVALYYTHHGPIVQFARTWNLAWSVRLPNFNGVNYSTGLYALMKASNLTEFKAALARQLIPRWNLLYSDNENIYWVHNATMARRAPGYNWRKPVPGWTKATEWGSYLPFEFYPQVLNPPSGWLQNCNNPPWVVTRASGLKPLAPAPYYLAQGQPRADAGEEVLNLRGERLFYELSRPVKFTLEDMIRLGFDTYVVPADMIVPLIERAYAQMPDARVARAVELIRRWDRRSSRDSVAFTYVYFWAEAYRELFPGKFQRFLGPARRRININARAEQRMAGQALVKAAEQIRKGFGKPEVPWGDINSVVRGGTFPLDGTGVFDVLHPDLGAKREDGRIHCDDGWGHLMVVMEGNPKQIWSLLPYGQSENPASPHYNDQAKLHSEGRLRRFWFTPAEILDHTESVHGERLRLKTIAAPRRTVRRSDRW
jgi:acyl-homoserine-lactone acylase